MREPLTSSLLAELIEQLATAFPGHAKRNAQMTADVYRNGLRGLSGDAVRDAVSRLIQTEQFFPKVAQIREAATAYERQRTVEIRRDLDWGQCAVCGARVTLRDYYHDSGRKDERGRPILVVAGQREHLEHDRRAHHVPEFADEGVA